MLAVCTDAVASLLDPPLSLHQDAAKFPIIGSAVLFSLFLAFKYLPKDLVNTVLAGEEGWRWGVDWQ